MIGLVILFLGFQIKAIESFVLSEPASQFMTERLAMVTDDDSGITPAAILPDEGPISTAQRTLKPPRWLGWAFISLGAVLILHSLAMKRPH